jgi:guanylate kinase
MPLVVVLSGPTGVGKDTIIGELRAREPRFARVITATSRPPRGEEKDGEAYLFFSRDEFERLIAEGALLEHALVYGDYKGVLRRPVEEYLEAGRDVILHVDPIEGAATLRKKIPEAFTVFIAPESPDELRARLVNRGDTDPAAVERRLEEFEREMAASSAFDRVVVNRHDAITETVDALSAYIREERDRPGRRPPRITGSA